MEYKFYIQNFNGQYLSVSDAMYESTEQRLVLMKNVSANHSKTKGLSDESIMWYFYNSMNQDFIQFYSNSPLNMSVIIDFKQIYNAKYDEPLVAFGKYYRKILWFMNFETQLYTIKEKSNRMQLDWIFKCLYLKKKLIKIDFD